MDVLSLREGDHVILNRRILTILWGIILITLIISLSFMLTIEENRLDYFQQNVFMPILYISVILLISELFIRWFNPLTFSFYILIISALICFMVISIRPTVRGIEGIFVLPILLSCVFFRIRMVITAAASTLSFYLLLVFTHAAYQAVIELRSVVAVSTVILAGGLIAYNVISRGRTALEKLQKSLESTQELKISNALMEKLSKIDALTKVNNHRAFQEYVAYILTYTPMKDFHLAIIDIDDFKKVNDTYGHQIGDTVLKATALIIQDTVSENDFVARYGGEEFVVVFFEKTSEEAIQLAEEIRLNIARHHFTELDNGQITISLGLSSYKSDMSKDSWFKEADHALYEAKKNGKNQIIVA